MKKKHIRFIHESPDISEMRELRERYQLEKIISEKKNEFDQIISLRNWVQKCWKCHGYDQIPEKNSALKILEAAGKGKIFQCWHYATVFVQSAVSLGFKARRLSIGIHPNVSRVGNNGHIIAEIWSSEYKKWLVMDPDMNAHYEIGGVPATALEIHNSWVRQSLSDVKYIQGEPTPQMISKYSPEEKGMEFVFGAYDAVDYYFRFQVEMRNNWFSSQEPVKPIAYIAWIDKYHPAYSERVGKVIDHVYWTNATKEFYWNED